MHFSDSMSSAILQACVGLLGVLIGSLIAWAGESHRAKESRLYDRRNRQYGAMCDLVDELERVQNAPYDGTIENDPMRRNVVSPLDIPQVLGWQSKRSLTAIRRAKRHAYDAPVKEDLDGVSRVWDRNTEVTAGLALTSTVPDEAPPGQPQPECEPADLSNIFTVDLWVILLIKSAEQCAQQSEKLLHERRSKQLRLWPTLALGLVAILTLGMIISLG